MAANGGLSLPSTCPMSSNKNSPHFNLITGKIYFLSLCIELVRNKTDKGVKKERDSEELMSCILSTTHMSIIGTFKGLNDESSLQHSLPNQMNQGMDKGKRQEFIF